MSGRILLYSLQVFDVLWAATSLASLWYDTCEHGFFVDADMGFTADQRPFQGPH